MGNGTIVNVTETLKGERAAWRIETQLPAEIRGQLGELSVMISHLLYCRGYRTVDAIRGFFTQGTISHDPFLLPDMALAVERIEQARARGERVAVYGDFDCDGITAAAVLMETLEGIGLRPTACIPTRGDGHGLHVEGLTQLRDAGVSLVITGDCGITAMEEVQVARGMGMDVIVTDHHEARPDGSLPDCPTIDPTRLDSQYPFRSLCGVGVAYKLAQAISTTIPGAADPEPLLDLVALGTVADVVPLRDENRSLVLRGLDALKETSRPGLLALFRAAGIEPKRIDPTAVGFYLAPRINAANRMATPQLAYDLITASDAERAAGLAAQLTTYNVDRQVLVAEHFEAIAEQIGGVEAVASEIANGTRPPLLIVVGDWPSGISGLLASKLVDAYGLAAFVGTDVGEGIVSVSARSLPGVHIDELLERCEDSLPGGLFLGYGGHARAGGFRVESDRVALARDILEEQARLHIPVDEIGRILQIDAEVGFGMLTLQAAKQIRTLAPFGIGFPEPLFLVRGAELKRLAPVRAGKHVRLVLRHGRTQMDGIQFNAPPTLLEIPLETRLDVVFHLQINEYNGLLKPELVIRDWRLTPA